MCVLADLLRALIKRKLKIPARRHHMLMAFYPVHPKLNRLTLAAREQWASVSSDQHLTAASRRPIAADPITLTTFAIRTVRQQKHHFPIWSLQVCLFLVFMYESRLQSPSQLRHGSSARLRKHLPRLWPIRLSMQRPLWKLLGPRCLSGLVYSKSVLPDYDIVLCNATPTAFAVA